MIASLLTTKLRRIGSGQGVLISKSICKLVGANVGDEFVLDIKEGSIVLLPGRKEEGED